MKNRVLAIMVLMMLTMPVSVQALEDVENLPDNAVEEQVQEELPAPITTPYKQPVSKRKVAKKFLLAMGGVAASSLLIYVTLSIYNRLREGFPAQPKFLENETPLETPNDMQSAVRTFLSKTNWKG